MARRSLSTLHRRGLGAGLGLLGAAVLLVTVTQAAGADESSTLSPTAVAVVDVTPAPAGQLTLDRTEVPPVQPSRCAPPD